MLLMNRNALLGLTLLAALGIGFVMQTSATERRAEAPEAPLKVTDIKLTAAASTPEVTPVLDTARDAPDTVIPVAATTADADAEIAASDDSLDAAVTELPCAIEMSALPGPAAMVALSLEASCLPNERVTIHHNGLMFSEMTDDAGALDLIVPALSPRAVFIASFVSGNGAVAQIDVASLKAYDRTVVQWKGNTGLGLHALEFGASYFDKGHIHAQAPGTTTATASGQQGLLVQLGRAELDVPLLAEVYTFPSQMTKTAGEVSLSVEAEVTASNCGRQVDAQTLEVHQSSAIKVQDLTLFMPDCATVGDFLVLKNLVEDLTIAAN